VAYISRIFYRTIRTTITKIFAHIVAKIFVKGSTAHFTPHTSHLTPHTSHLIVLKVVIQILKNADNLILSIESSGCTIPDIFPYDIRFIRISFAKRMSVEFSKYR